MKKYFIIISVLKSSRDKLQELFLGRDCPDNMYSSFACLAHFLYLFVTLFDRKPLFFDEYFISYFIFKISGPFFTSIASCLFLFFFTPRIYLTLSSLLTDATYFFHSSSARACSFPLPPATHPRDQAVPNSSRHPAASRFARAEISPCIKSGS